MRAYVFTVNNPTGELPAYEHARYISWQLEKGDNGTPHWQGYVELTKPQRIAALKKWLPTAHFEVRRGTRDQARDYTRKSESREDGPWERGVWEAGGSGARNDLQSAAAAIKDGATKREVFEQYPEIAAKYPRFVDQALKYAADDKVERITEFTPLYPFQKTIIDLVAADVIDRQILWVHDPFGNSGKSYISKYLVDSKGAFYTNGGKATDIAYAYNGEPIVIFDYVRDAKDYVGYGIMEQIKNGILFSSKYESGMRRFKTPHVIVFANFAPEAGKFSSDRLRVIELNSAHLSI